MRKNRDNESANEEFRIRFIDVSVKGSSVTLQEAIRSIADAVGQRPVITTPPAPQAIASSSVDAGQRSLDFGDVQEGEIADVVPKTTNGNSKPKRRTYTKPNLLEVDLDNGEVSFEDYCGRKNPSDTTKKYLVVAAWFQLYRDENIITADHIYTCYRKMGWAVQKDVGQPLRSGKKLAYFKSGPNEGTYELTHIGLDVVRKMGGE